MAINEQDFEVLYLYSNRLVSAVSMQLHRYLYRQINWSNRLIGIKGSRGIGKSTLLLQHIRETFPSSREALYVSMDNLWFRTHDIMDLVEYHFTHGGTHILLDEVHYLPHWQTVLKNIYDAYPQLHIVYTGSSMLEIDAHEGDLSRRQRLYTLYGLSFREYLLFEGYEVGDAHTLEELLQSHESIAMPLTQKMKVLPLFSDYLRHGYYPFYKEEGDGFYERVQSMIRQVLENDLPHIEDVSFVSIQKIQRMLMILAERVPFTPKMAELYRELDTNRELGLKMLYALDRAALLAIYTNEVKNVKSLSKPDKIYLDNTNLMYCLSTHIDVGTLRETFFFNQLRATQEVLLPKDGDFMINRTYLFEVGGRNKTFDQIKDIPNSFLAIDDLEIGHHNRIPLWMFGLLY